MLSTFFKILPFFLVIVLGSIFGLFNKKFNQSTVSELNRFSYFIGFPCLILNSFISIEVVPKQAITMASINTGILLAFLGLLTLVLHFLIKDKKLQNTYFISTFFGNIAYLGFPLVYSINPSYSADLSLHIASYLILLFTIGILKLEFSKVGHSPSFGKIFRNVIFNPLLLATLIGIVLSLARLQLPSTLREVINMVALSASPVVLFAIGVFIVQNKIFNKALVHISIITLIKLLLLPALFVVWSIFLWKDFDLTVSIMLAAMPVAITPFVLAEIYDLDKNIIAGAILLSTTLAIFTIPFIFEFL